MASKQIEDGGAAFPLLEDGPHSSGGMSLRDWFAGNALVGIISAEGEERTGSPLAALRAFELADAMIAARKATT
ncbi:hypothetical protein [Rhizobium lentis]|uniref:hypothetical protein n=1 Tax=Rhizobium lentis TaxID=1138194 RepID=UPI001A92265A|nr:hypothetical protein [Rhizobium lentis]MBX5063283.1 hypothetical protein [Rhizobium lentis]MBX5075388.1 hypothetical protein [Rhizobium lentis]QSW93047.1 hypothetical protein J0663_18525 [Rhizobium lentis]